MVDSQAVGATPSAEKAKDDLCAEASASVAGPSSIGGSYIHSSSEHQRAQLAELLLASGKAPDALACADAALLAAPASAELLHLRGRCLLAAGNVPGAPPPLIAAWQDPDQGGPAPCSHLGVACIAHGPGRAGAAAGAPYGSTRDCHWRAGRRRICQQPPARAHAQRPHPAPPPRSPAAGAFASFMSVLAADPSHLPALLELGAIYKGKGLLNEARDVRRRAGARGGGAGDGADGPGDGGQGGGAAGGGGAAVQGGAGGVAQPGGGALQPGGPRWCARGISCGS